MNIEQGNKDFINKINNDKELKNRRDELVKGQHPETLVITCSDSRVVPEMIFNCFLGDIFVIRTAGNVINEGELATVEYAIEHLKVKRIVVLGHTHCGAVHASIHKEKGRYLDPILKRIEYNIGNICVELEASTINAAKEADFDDSKLVIKDGYFQITIPQNDKVSTEAVYGIHIVIKSDCGGADTVMHFRLNYDKDVIDQRYDNVLGLLTKPFEGKTLSDFQWYRASDSTAVEGQISSNLNFYDLPQGEFSDDKYYICFTVNKGLSDEVKTCACGKAFINTGKQHDFDTNPDGLVIKATYSMKAGDVVFVNADYKGEADIECYAQWITANGKIYNDLNFTIPDGGCTIPTPKEGGLYLLRVITGKESRSFKMIINQ